MAEYRKKPLCFGRVFNVTPPMVNTAKLIFQVNDGAVDAVSMVYDHGKELTQGADYANEADLLDDLLAPAVGFYKVWPAGGYFRLGAIAVGPITVDIRALERPWPNAGRLEAWWTCLTFCPECGPGIAVDEEGLCLGCGATAIGSWVGEVLSALNKFREREREPSPPAPWPRSSTKGVRDERKPIQKGDDHK